jgi:hypothetical protein
MRRLPSYSPRPASLPATNTREHHLERDIGRGGHRVSPPAHARRHCDDRATRNNSSRVVKSAHQREAVLRAECERLRPSCCEALSAHEKASRARPGTRPDRTRVPQADLGLLLLRGSWGYGQGAGGRFGVNVMGACSFGARW